MIFDFTTRAIAKVLSAHVQPLCSLSWSRNGRRLMTAGTDNTVAIWDVLSGECCHRFRFTSLITKIQFHPRNDDDILVCLLKSSSIVLRVHDGSTSVISCDNEAAASDMQITTASYDRRGKYIICGNAKGTVSIIDSKTLSTTLCFRLQSNHPIRLIETATRGNYFLTCSNDRIIKIYDLDELLCKSVSTASPEPVQKLQDLVNKTPWKSCCFSGDGEFVCAASARTHALYIWERNNGSLVKILHGIKGETLLDVVWHPAKPLICSISNTILSIWSQTHHENWSAFAPDFKELDENVEYDERESEFDLEDDDRSVQLNAGEKPSEDVEVDVVTVGSSSLCFSSDDEGGEPSDALWYLPVAPEVDDPEEPPTGFIFPTTNAPPDAQQTTSASATANLQNIPPPMKNSPAVVDISIPTRAFSPDTEMHAMYGTSGRKKQTTPRQKRRKGNDSPHR